MTIYKAILSPIWRYALQIYGMTAKANLNKIRVAQAKILRQIRNAVWYIRTRDIEKDLKVPKVGDVMQKVVRLDGHPNPLAKRLNKAARIRRLKKCYSQDLPARFI